MNNTTDAKAKRILEELGPNNNGRFAAMTDFARALEDEITVLRHALTTIRTSGNDSQQCIWMQKVAASALEPGRWPDAGKSPLG